MVISEFWTGGENFLQNGGHSFVFLESPRFNPLRGVLNGEKDPLQQITNLSRYT